MTSHRRWLVRLLDQDRAWDEAEAEQLLEALRTDRQAALLLKDQLLMDNLLSRRFSPERRDFTNRVLQRLRGSEEASRFIEKTLSRSKRVATGGASDGRPSRSWRPLALAATVALGIGISGFVVRERRQARAPEAADPSTGIARDEAPGERALPRRQSGTHGDARTARITKVEGEAFVVGSLAGNPGVTARAGEVVQVGQALVTTAGNSAVTLSYGDATWVRLRGNSSVVPLAVKQLFVSRGTVEARVTGAGEAMVLSTPHGQAVARLSTLTLSVTERTTRLDVEQGSVRLTAHRGGAAQEVLAGRYAQTTDAAEPVSGARAMGGRAALLTGSDNQTGADKALLARLEKLGFEAHTILQGPRAETEARQSALVVISDSVSSQDFAENWLRGLPVPAVVMDWWLFDDLGMTGPCGNSEECGHHDSVPGHLFIKNAHHPLAAGLAGTVRFTGKWVQLNWGTPNLNASWVANVPGFPMRATIFAYERGAEMFGLPAPARRVALPIRGKAGTMLTDEGWALFDAAVHWCAEQPAR